MNLTTEQQNIVDQVLAGTSIFFTGAAGTGKSTVLRHLLDKLPRSTTYMTAYTGIAAQPLHGTTLHKFCGIGLGVGTVQEIMYKLGRQGTINLRACRVLVIDEISMLSGELFDKIEEIARIVRGSEAPFGGIQLVLCGDYYQCPPITDSYTFEAQSWSSCVAKTIQLQLVHRQKGESLLDLMNAVRHNRCEQHHIDMLDRLKRPLQHDDGILATRLYCKNADVDRENAKELNRLPDPEYEYVALDTGTGVPLMDLQKNTQACELLKLRVGAQVMMIKNSDTLNLFNGSRGVVTAFVNGMPRVKFTTQELVMELATWTVEDRRGKVLASRQQLPLKLAFCITVHKSQGMTIDRLVVKIDDAHDYGIAYVALSRCTNEDGLQITAWHQRKFKVNRKVREFYRSMV